MRGGFFPAVGRTHWAKGSLTPGEQPANIRSWGCVTDEEKSAAAVVALSCVSEVNLLHVEWPDCGTVDHGSGDVWVQQTPDIHPKSTGHFGELRLYHRAIRQGCQVGGRERPVQPSKSRPAIRLWCLNRACMLTCVDCASQFVITKRPIIGH